MKSYLHILFVTITVACTLTACDTPEQREEKQAAKHQADFLNNPPPPMSKPQ